MKKPKQKNRQRQARARTHKTTPPEPMNRNTPYWRDHDDKVKRLKLKAVVVLNGISQ